MTKVYPADMTRCALCECRIRATKHFALYAVGDRGAIGYLLCDACGPKVRRGLGPEELRKLDAKLEAIAVAHGLTTTH